MPYDTEFCDVVGVVGVELEDAMDCPLLESYGLSHFIPPQTVLRALLDSIVNFDLSPLQYPHFDEFVPQIIPIDVIIGLCPVPQVVPQDRAPRRAPKSPSRCLMRLA